MTPLPRSFYEPSAKTVARNLLGHLLLRRIPGGWCGGEIVETEAYLTGDPACHAFRGVTPRTKIMWGEPGRAYVYLIYGFYNCFNTVCRPAGMGEAVLVRAIEPSQGADFMHTQRPVKELHHLTSGPGKLCRAMDIPLSLNGVDLCDADSEIWVAENPEIRAFRRASGPVITTTRIGINVGADLPLRFYLEKSKFVSRRVSKR